MRRALVMIAVFALVVPAAADTYKLDGKTAKITFTGFKAGGKHDGGFKKLDGTATVDADDFSTLKIDLVIETDSLYSDDQKLTGHLKAPDFFSVKEFPKATFKVTKVEKGKGAKERDSKEPGEKDAKDAKDSYTLTGDLTLLGKTKPVSIPAKVKVDGGQLVITSDFAIKRSEWGMDYKVGKKKGEVYDEVKLKIDVKAKK